MVSLSPQVSAEPEQHSILVLGDSISAAYGIDLEAGWVALLDDKLTRSHPSYHVINASISGDTTAGGLRRLPELLTRHQPAIVIIELGGNDGLRGYPIKQLRQNIEQMAQLSQAQGARVLILPMEIPPNLGKVYTDAFRQSFASAAESSGAHLGEFPLTDVALDLNLMQRDGIHPTAAAQPLILERVWQSLEQLL